MTAAPVADLRHDGQVVRDEDQRQAELLAERRLSHEQLEDLRLHHHVERGRRLVGEQHLRASRRAPSRSRPAGASRPRTRAGSGRPGRPRCRRARAARRPALAPPCRSRRPCSSIGSAICSPIVLTGLNAFIAPWKTIAMSFQRCGLIVSSPPREDVLAVEEHRARRPLAVGGSRPISARIVGRLAAAGLADEARAARPRRSSKRDALDGVQLAAARQVEPDVEVLDLEQRRRSSASSFPRERPQPEAPHREVADAQPRVEGVLHRLADHRAGEDRRS